MGDVPFAILKPGVPTTGAAVAQAAEMFWRSIWRHVPVTKDFGKISSIGKNLMLTSTAPSL